MRFNKHGIAFVLNVPKFIPNIQFGFIGATVIRDSSSIVRLSY